MKIFVPLNDIPSLAALEARFQRGEIVNMVNTPIRGGYDISYNEVPRLTHTPPPLKDAPTEALPPVAMHRQRDLATVQPEPVKTVPCPSCEYPCLENEDCPMCAKLAAFESRKPDSLQDARYEAQDREINLPYKDT